MPTLINSLSSLKKTSYLSRSKILSKLVNNRKLVKAELYIPDVGGKT